jgi:DNA-binding MarR family transcriptional regulator
MAPIPSRRASVIAARFGSEFDDVDPKAKEIAARLVQLVALFEQENRPLFEHHQIHRGLFSALVSLRLAGEPYELRHRDLMDRMLLTSGGITNLCRKLQQLGLIDRRAEAEDGRSVCFRLTAAGIALADEIIPQQHRNECELVSALNSDEKDTLCSLLEKLTQYFNP